MADDFDNWDFGSTDGIPPAPPQLPPTESDPRAAVIRPVLVVPGKKTNRRRSFSFTESSKRTLVAVRTSSKDRSNAPRAHSLHSMGRTYIMVRIIASYLSPHVPSS
jgi:hypothetical protein